MKASELLRKIMELQDGEPEPTKEMRDWFETRTRNHIQAVSQYLEKAAGIYPELKLEILEMHHDESKFREPELTPYIHLTWEYRSKDMGLPYRMSAGMRSLVLDATYHHIKNNRHHPEYWDPLATPCPQKLNGTTQSAVCATNMPDDALLEMVCDWCAMSRERGGDPGDWFAMVNGPRFEFTDEQQSFIRRAIASLWDGQADKTV